MNNLIKQDFSLRIEKRFDGNGETAKKASDFSIFYKTEEIAVGSKDRQTFSYQLNMGELERLDLKENLQEICHYTSLLANKAYSSDWDFSGYDITSWNQNYDYYKLNTTITKQQEFVQKIIENQEKNKERRTK